MGSWHANASMNLRVLILPACLSALVFGATLTNRSTASRRGPFGTSGFQENSLTGKREAAYRANNRGVALLEQYKTKEAAEAFTRALE